MSTTIRKGSKYLHYGSIVIAGPTPEHLGGRRVIAHATTAHTALTYDECLIPIPTLKDAILDTIKAKGGACSTADLLITVSATKREVIQTLLDLRTQKIITSDEVQAPYKMWRLV